MSQAHATDQLFLNRTTLVVGLGKSGQATLRYLSQQGVPLSAADTRIDCPAEEALKIAYPEMEIMLGPLQPELLKRVERIVLSPGISVWDKAIQQAVDAGVEVVGDVELFARLAQAPIVAITGSNGKSTVTTLVAAMAEQAGIRVVAGGNLGTPVLELLQEEVPDLYVVELSSFQLETTASLQAAAAVVLNVSPDHMDRYQDLDQYGDTKMKIYHNAQCAVVPKEDVWVQQWLSAHALESSEVVDYSTISSAAYRICNHALCYGDKELLPVSAMKMAGEHNWSNALAALALGAAVGLPQQAMVDTLRTYPGLPHRTEWVAEESGVRWINDSKGTNVGAAEAAIRGLSSEDGKIIWIAGGQGKGADFTPLRTTLSSNVRCAILLGEDREAIAAVVEDRVAVIRVETMEMAVARAAEMAAPGDTVLLSPACASFDQFSGFEARGDAFKRAVTEQLEREPLEACL